jgi:hypothetical protein
MDGGGGEEAWRSAKFKAYKIARRRRRRRRKQRQLFFIRWVTVRTEEYSFCSSAGGAVMGSMLQLFYILNSHIDI